MKLYIYSATLCPETDSHMWKRMRSSLNIFPSPLSEVVVLLLETGFFQGIAWKAFQGYTHRRMGGIVARFTGTKRKDCPQVSDVSSRTSWLSSVSLRKKSTSGSWDAYLSSPSPEEGPGPRGAVPLAWHGQGTWSFSRSVESSSISATASVVQLSLCPPLASLASVPGCVPVGNCAAAPRPLLWPVHLLQRENMSEQMGNEWMNKWMNPGPLLDFDYFASGLGKCRLSFKVTNLFLTLLACAGPAPSLIPFL